MSKRRLCLSSLILLLVVTLFLAVMPLMGNFSVKADESVVYNDDVLVDFNANGVAIDSVVYASSNVKLQTDIHFYDGTPEVKYTALTTAAGSSTGYVVFNFIAPEGKIYSGLNLEFEARLFDYNNPRTFERLNFYIGEDVEDLDACGLVYKSTITNKSNGQIINLDLDKYVAGSNGFFVKVEIGNSGVNTDWVALKDVEFDLSYAETYVNYVLFDQYGTEKEITVYTDIGELVGFDTSSFINFERLDQKVYTDIQNVDGVWTGIDPVADLGVVSSEATYYIKGVWDKYTITYVLNGGVNDPANVDSYVSSQGMTFETPGKSGYKFGGWYLDEELTEPIFEILKGQKGDITLYAKWVKDTPIEKDVDPIEKPNAGCGSSVGADTLIASSIILTLAGLFLSIRFIKRKSK